jgi:hypothetical protein
MIDVDPEDHRAKYCSSHSCWVGLARSSAKVIFLGACPIIALISAGVKPLGFVVKQCWPSIFGKDGWCCCLYTAVNSIFSLRFLSAS